MSARVILDCDNACGIPGRDIDDALVLAYLLGREDVTVEAVTSVFGNTQVDQVTHCTRRLLARTGRTEVPVISGAAGPGEITSAAAYLAQAAARAPGTLTVLATGPLTNVAAAGRLDPAFYQNVRAIHCMGGYFGEQRIGLRRAGELNLSADPRAAHAVMANADKVYLFVTEICRQLPFRVRDLPLLWGLDRALVRHVLVWLSLYGSVHACDRFYLWDLLPALFLTHRHAFASTVRGGAPDPGALAKGQVVLTEVSGSIVAPQALIDPGALRRDIAAAWRRTMPATRTRAPATRRPAQTC